MEIKVFSRFFVGIHNKKFANNCNENIICPNSSDIRIISEDEKQSPGPIFESVIYFHITLLILANKPKIKIMVKY